MVKKAAVLIFPAALLFAFSFGAFSSGYALEKADPLERYAVPIYNNTGEVVPEENMPELTGRVTRVREKDRGRLELTVHSGGRNILVRADDTGYTPSDVIGRKIRFSGTVEMPAARRNPGCFDYRLYLMTMDIRVIVKSGEGQTVLISDADANVDADIVSGIDSGGGSGRDPLGDVFNVLCGAKYRLLARAEQGMTQESYGLFVGMMFGDTSEMDDEIYGMFQKNGIAHILSVSGMHVAIVYAFFNVLFGRRRTVSVSLLIAGALIVYAVLSEFSPSVVRAVVMILLHILSGLIARRYDMLTGTCGAALIMLVQNPLELFSVGFQLSFLAVLLLSFGLPLAGRFVGYRDTNTGRVLSTSELDVRIGMKQGRFLKSGLCTGLIPLLVIQLGMVPITAWAFNYVSVSGLVLNIPVALLSGMILPAGIVMLLLSIFSDLSVPVLSGLSDTLVQIGARGTQTLIETMNGCAAVADGFRYSHFMVVSPQTWFLFVFYGILFFLMSEGFRVLMSRHLFRPAALTLVLIAVLGFLTAASPYCQRSEAALTFVDVGQGDCLHIRTPDGKNYLIDGGGQTDYNVGEKVLLPYLLKNGVSELDGVFLTHLHTDHYKGIKELSMQMDVGTVFLYDGNRVRPEQTISGSAIAADDLVYLARGDRVLLGGGVALDVLSPPVGTMADYEEVILMNEDENRSSLLMRLDYNGVSALMTGDLGAEGELDAVSFYESGEGKPGTAGDDPYLPQVHSGTDENRPERSPLQSDILKVGHHGSRFSTSDEFLSAVSPEYAVIQSGRNTFGHPTAVVLEKLRGNDIMVF
ncbi:MAG: ComEC/Rec2 family competence protein, partial [Clostridiales Family XIII bacterium]|nr:ComEC/Rec2 family competence protein [Clostridiales Family XIII bacterium]